MCRGGKDGVVRRCKANQEQHASSVLRKRVKYRADKEGVTPEEWKENNVDELNSFKQELFPIKISASFQSINETRTLPEGIPARLEDHIAMNEKELAHLNDLEKKAIRAYAGFSAGIANTVLLAGSDKNYNYYDEADPWRETRIGPTDFATPEDLQDYLEVMDGLFEKRQEESRIVYRGIPIYRELHDEIGASIGKDLHVTDTDGLVKGLKEYYKTDKVFSYDTYLSTTSSAHYAADRTSNSIGTKETHWSQPEVRGIVFELKTNAGVDITSAAGHNAYEREVVIPRETFFKVVNIDVRPEQYDTVGGYGRRSRDKDTIEAEKYEGIAAIVQMVEVDKDGNEINHTEPHKPQKPISDLFDKK